MKERPILMSGAMVRAILDDRKTQTRRVVKLKLHDDGSCGYASHSHLPGRIYTRDELPLYFSPYGVPGDRLWVREAWRTLQSWDALAPRNIANDPTKITFEADAENRNPLWAFGKLRPRMFMPRWASRITLEIVAVRVERLQDIDEADAEAEGCERSGPNDQRGDERNYYDGYRELWNTINGPGAWDKNPWVWVVEFRRMK